MVVELVVPAVRPRGIPRDSPRVVKFIGRPRGRLIRTKWFKDPHINLIVSGAKPRRSQG